MMAVRAPIPFSLNPGASSNAFQSRSPGSASSHSSGAAGPEADVFTSTNASRPGSNLSRARSPMVQGDLWLRQSPTKQSTWPEKDRSIATTREVAVDISDEENEKNDLSNDQHARTSADTKQGLISPVKSSTLKIDVERSSIYTPSHAKDDEPPQSVIHAPLGFGKFNRSQQQTLDLPEKSSVHQPTTKTPRPADQGGMGTSTVSAVSSESAASDVTITRLVGKNTEAVEKPTLIPLLQTQLPLAPEWTKTPRAQTRRDLGVLSRPGSGLASLASISEAEDDQLDNITDLSIDEQSDVEDRPIFYRTEEDEMRTLHTALSECWTLCNTLAGLSYIHREKIFSRKGNMQQQAWRSCWRLCQNLYETRNEDSPVNVRLTLDLCREFCQALFDVRARDNEAADSVLRVSFELNNHLFNTHDRNLPEAFSERTLDFYITLCHRLMKQRSTMIEETGSLLRACWALAEMLFSIRQTRREGRKPDEELMSSAIQACWELCDLFRDGWTQIRPERQTPRPAQTTLTQAFQQARRVLASANDPSLAKLLPETPTTIFEDINAESPFETNAPNIFVLGPGESAVPQSAISSQAPSSYMMPEPRKSAYRWPSVHSNTSVTTLSTSSSNSIESSVRTVRSPSDDPNMALLKSLFVRAAIHTRRGFSPLASTTLSTLSAHTSLPVFVKSLPETAFGNQAWQTSLLDSYRKAVNNDPTFRMLGIAANPTLLGMEGDESIRAKVKVDTARAISSVVSTTFGWAWLKDLFRFAFDANVDDVLVQADT